MKRFISYGSIGQFRNTIRDVANKVKFVGMDEEAGTPIYDMNKKKPKVVAHGTEKIHGTNASVCYSNEDGFWVQSRKNIIHPEKDNAGCAFMAYQKEESWMNLIKCLSHQHKIDLDKHIISLYFEWCGGNIQKNSAVSSLEKRAIIFKHFKVSPIDADSEENAFWLETGGVCVEDDLIFNIAHFPTVEVLIDFENPQMSQNKMIELVDELEPNSKVGQQFGVDGNVGEGYVFTFEFEGDLFKFKVKGEKHAGKSKVKTLKPVDEELENKKIEFANNIACTQTRLEQAWQNTFGIENEKMSPTIKEMGTFLRFIHNDVIKEESDILVEMGLEPKSVNGKISSVAKVWFQDKLDEEAMK